MSIASKPRKNTQTKKRIAQHHSQSKRYLKHYWPYLPMLVIIGLGFVFNSLLTNGSQVLGAQTDLSRAGLLQYTNQDRVADHENNLKFNTNLNNAAQNKANDMVKNDYWAHNSPSGKTPWTWILGSGYEFQQAGENLAYGFTTSTDVITAWMNSPEHRANMLDSKFEDVGFGIAESANYRNEGPKIIVVAEYGEPLISVAGPAVPTATTPPITEPATKSISRIAILTGSSATWSELVLTALVGAAAATFIIRHGLYLRKLLFQGESLIIHHPFLDIAIVLFCTAGVLLIHSAGLIS